MEPKTTELRKELRTIDEMLLADIDTAEYSISMAHKEGNQEEVTEWVDRLSNDLDARIFISRLAGCSKLLHEFSNDDIKLLLEELNIRANDLGSYLTEFPNDKDATNRLMLIRQFTATLCTL